MTTIHGSVRANPALPVTGVLVGVASIAAWLVPGVVGMLIVGTAGSVAILLGVASLASSRSGVPARNHRFMGIVAVALGLLGLAGLWVTAIIVSAVPV